MREEQKPELREHVAGILGIGALVILSAGFVIALISQERSKDKEMSGWTEDEWREYDAQLEDGVYDDSQP